MNGWNSTPSSRFIAETIITLILMAFLKLEEPDIVDFVLLWY
uniref:Uncharacterized protein n=1 Tax=Nelumbo nucifera TaxID=4432 RepID=A0A822Z581_NELNU|nr:TPA_asm: hypothetical protein HUJ06_014073 [Nelumbo nucifera]